MKLKTLILIISGILLLGSFSVTWYLEWNFWYFGITSASVTLFNLIYFIGSTLKKKQKTEFIEKKEDFGLSEEECKKLIRNKFLEDEEYRTNLIIIKSYSVVKGKETAPKTPLYIMVAKDMYRNLYYKIILRRLTSEPSTLRFKNLDELEKDKMEDYMATSPKERSVIKERFKNEEGKEVTRIISPEKEEKGGEEWTE